MAIRPFRLLVCQTVWLPNCLATNLHDSLTVSPSSLPNSLNRLIGKQAAVTVVGAMAGAEMEEAMEEEEMAMVAPVPPVPRPVHGTNRISQW